MSMDIAKRIEWDMGHRIPFHDSKCKNPHGHRYVCEAVLRGKLVEAMQAPEQGMVLDFSKLKQIANERIVTVCDHAFMYWSGDTAMGDFFMKNPDFASLAVPFIPTAEEIARWAFDQISPAIVDTYGTGLQLLSIRLWETPNSLVTYSPLNNGI